MADETAVEARNKTPPPKKNKGTKKPSSTKTTEETAPITKPLGLFQANRMDLEAEASNANKALQQLYSGVQQTVSKFSKNLLEQSSKTNLKR